MPGNSHKIFLGEVLLIFVVIKSEISLAWCWECNEAKEWRSQTSSRICKMLGIYSSLFV